MGTPLYDQIIVPLDVCELAETALPTAVSLSSALNAPILLLRIVDFTKLERYGPCGAALDYASYEPVIGVEERDALDYLDGIKQQMACEGVSISFQVVRSAVVREIIKLAGQQDLIVLASNGRSGISRWLLGSVAEDSVRNGRPHVLLVRADTADSPVRLAPS